MYTRLFHPPEKQSFFLLGPRGVGKTKWLNAYYPNANKIDLLNFRIMSALSSDPTKLETYILDKTAWVVIDEIQKVPQLLDEVHRLIESRNYKFVLTGSSARKLKRAGANLLAGRALGREMFPLVVDELGVDFSLEKSLHCGHLPMAYLSEDPGDFLQSYLQTYLREEVQQEGFVRNLNGFTRFLETCSFSQGQYLNISKVASDAQVDRKVTESYFQILEDLLLAYRLPHFRKKAERKTNFHPKFFIFDVGVYRVLRPRGPEDNPEFIDGAALETLVYQELKANNSYHQWGFDFYCWKENNDLDVDLVLYGRNEILAFEIKRSSRLRGGELKGLEAFSEKFPKCCLFYLYGGTEERKIGKIHLIPVDLFLKNIKKYILTSIQQKP